MARLKAEVRVSVDYLDSLFIADHGAGVLYWRERNVTDHRVAIWNTRFANKRAGRINTAGHRQIIITVNGERIHTTAHRVLWAMRERSWPADDLVIDHIDGAKDDNRQEEIRLATNVQNAQNKRIYKNNTSGFKGVSWSKALERWFVTLQVDRKVVRVGYFDDLHEAARAYDTAAMRYHGQFARTNTMMGLI